MDLETELRAGPPGASPPADVGERLSRAAGDEGLLDVAWAPVDSPIGRLLAAATERGLVRLAFAGEEPDRVLALLATRVSPRVLEAPARLDHVRRGLDDYFAGRRRHFADVSVDWALVSPFGRRVLGALAGIGWGEVTTYAGLAAGIGKPRAARAVGNALGANPVPIVVPCHRVLRTGGSLGGYGGGLDLKRRLLSLEGVSPPG
jgi:methylated-DNA-[protein]-cysteine S-methyltransferase